MGIHSQSVISSSKKPSGTGFTRGSTVSLKEKEPRAVTKEVNLFSFVENEEQKGE